jgi:hypothetical protein
MAGRRLKDWPAGLEGEQREVCVEEMGTGRAGAVTDPNCRLRQMKNVHPAKSRICAEKGKPARQKSVKSDESSSAAILSHAVNRVADSRRRGTQT